jgi:hypothetical protein
MEIIKDQDKEIIAIIYRDEDWQKGLNFITPDNLFIQVGSWWYDKGTNLDAHKHIKNKREAEITQEMVYVKDGSMRVDLYSDDKSFIKSFNLYKGDLSVLVSGGHGYEILENNTQIIESKNGPFINVDKDKKKF